MPELLTFASHEHAIRLTAQELAPATAREAGALRPAILLLHGSGGNLDFWTNRLGPILAEAGVHLYAPHYFDRTGTARADLQTITDGIHVPQWLRTVDDCLKFIAARPGVDPQRIILAGISLGAFLAMALAAQRSALATNNRETRLRGIIEISGGLVPPYEALATRDLPPTLILHGAADTVVPVSFAESLTRRLTELGVPHQSVILPGEGHWFGANAWPRLLMAVSTFLQPLIR